MFESLLIALNDARENGDYSSLLPESHDELRGILVDELLKNTTEYGLGKGKQMKQRLRMMKKAGQQPIAEVLLAAAKIYNLKIMVYYGMQSPIVFGWAEAEGNCVIRLQCISQVHYNPLYERRKMVGETVEVKYVNIMTERNRVDSSDVESGSDCDEYDLHEPKCAQSSCSHTTFHLIGGVGSNRYCCLLDTGAQVSLVNERVVNEMMESGHELEIRQSSSALVGLDRGKQGIKGYVVLELSIYERQVGPMPFAVVSEDAMPCCFLLGANFIKRNNVGIDFGKDQIVFHDGSNSDKFQINCAILNDSRYRLNILNQLNVRVEEDEVYTSSDEMSVFTDEEVEDDIIPRYEIPKSELKVMQQNNHALKRLKSNIIKDIPVNSWNYAPLNQFKRSAKKLSMRDGLLVFNGTNHSPVVVSFPFMVEIVYKTHLNINHAGRHKLLKMIEPHFWHPGMDKLCLEICRTCEYCQKYKSHRIDKPPPVVKIDSSYPFELVCCDVMSLERTRKGNVALLVCVDHFSKWLAATPIKNKQARTVAEAWRSRILPAMTRVPDRLHSDNGPEFVSREFEEMMQENSIEHSRSSPFHPAGNGACERVNRTIRDRLCGEEDWDEEIAKIVVQYNNMTHSEIKMSLSQMILSNLHVMKPKLVIDAATKKHWREGHPNFSPFKLGQLVLKKVNFKGRQLKDKLSIRYKGPYLVKTVHSNGLSYGIVEEGKEEVVYNVNHRQLRAYHQVPRYIGRYLFGLAQGERSEMVGKSCVSRSRVSDETEIILESSEVESISSSEYSFEGFTSPDTKNIGSKYPSIVSSEESSGSDYSPSVEDILGASTREQTIGNGSGSDGYHQKKVSQCEKETQVSPSLTHVSTQVRQRKKSQSEEVRHAQCLKQTLSVCNEMVGEVTGETHSMYNNLTAFFKTLVTTLSGSMVVGERMQSTPESAFQTRGVDRMNQIMRNMESMSPIELPGKNEGLVQDEGRISLTNEQLLRESFKSKIVSNLDKCESSGFSGFVDEDVIEYPREIPIEDDKLAKQFDRVIQDIDGIISRLKNVSTLCHQAESSIEGLDENVMNEIQDVLTDLPVISPNLRFMDRSDEAHLIRPVRVLRSRIIMPPK